MAMTADSSSNHHSPPPRDGAAGGTEAAVNSPRVHRKNLASPWAQVVRGELKPSPASDQPPSPRQSSPDTETPCSPSRPVAEGLHAAREGSYRNSGSAASAPPKKPAWSKPSSSEAMVEASSVMGDAISWPALSESIRNSPKVQSADPPAPGSNSGSQVRPIIGHSPKKSVPAANHVNPSFAPNHTSSVRQKLTKHGGGNSGSNSGVSNSGSGLVQIGYSNPSPPVALPPPPPPPFPILVGPNAYGNFMPPMVDPSVSHLYKGNTTWEGRPGFFHHNSSRRGNFGSNPRPDGPSHRGYGGRRDNDRGGHYRGVRDVNIPPQRANLRGDGGGFVRTPPPNAIPFFPPQDRPLGPMPFPDFYYPAMHMEPYRAGGPFFPSAAPVPMLIPVVEDPSVSIVNQINYYFSDENLVKDEYLKSNMDTEGWVPIGLIASFPRVKSLTTDTKHILDTMKSSTMVEVQGEKLRRRNDWKKWILSESGSPSSSVGLSHNALAAAASFQKMTVEEMPLTEPISEGDAAAAASKSTPPGPHENNI